MNKTELVQEIERLQAELAATGRGSLSCSLCKLPVVFEFTVPSDQWNRIVRAKGHDEYLCFWCFDGLAVEDAKERRQPIGVNINGQVAFSNWCGDDVPGAYESSERERLKQELDAREGKIIHLRTELEHRQDHCREHIQMLETTEQELEQAKERERQLREAILENWCEEVFEIPQSPYFYCVYCRNDAMSSKENIKHAESCVYAKLKAEAALTVPPAQEQSTWQCGCGWTNGINLAKCAMCGRTPVESVPPKEQG